MSRRKTRPKDGIYQRPDSPTWWACYPNEQGGSTRRSTGVPIADDPQGINAHAIRAAWRTERRAEQTGDGATFDDLIMLYLDQVTPTKRDPRRDRWSAKALFPVLTGKRLSEINAADVRGYIASRTAVGIAPGTINKEVGLMSAATNWARRELEWEIPNPWQARRQREPDGRNRWLKPDEAERLLKAAETRKDRYPWLHDFIRLGLNSGMRPGEMLGMEWERVDLKGRVVTFEARHQKNGKPGTVPLNHEAREAMLSRARFRASHCPDSPWVFCRQDGSPILKVSKGFAGCARDAGLTDVHPHDLRRTFGSWLVQSGIGIERVSALLRHGDVAITARVYAICAPTI